MRYGTNTPFYLWEASNRREAECVLMAAEQFLSGGGRDNGAASPGLDGLTRGASDRGGGGRWQGGR